MAVNIIETVFAAYIAAMIFPLIIKRGGSTINHFSPQSIYVDIISIVEHIGGVAARWPHINLQSYIVSRAGLKKLDMEKSLFDLKCGNSTAAYFLKLPGEFFQRIIKDMILVIDHLHDPLAIRMGSTENDIAVSIRQPVKGKDCTINKTLHYIIVSRFLLNKGEEFFLVMNLEGVKSANPVIRFGDNRETCFFDELLCLSHGVNNLTGSNLDTGLPKDLLHP